MSSTVVVIITAIAGAIYLYLPALISFLFPSAPEEHVTRIVDLLIKLIEALLNQLSLVTS